MSPLIVAKEGNISLKSLSFEIIVLGPGLLLKGSVIRNIDAANTNIESGRYPTAIKNLSLTGLGKDICERLVGATTIGAREPVAVLCEPIFTREEGMVAVKKPRVVDENLDEEIRLALAPMLDRLYQTGNVE